MIHYDARHGWFRIMKNDRIKPLVNQSEPFADREQAIAYALAQLQDEKASIYVAVVNARKALEFAQGLK